MIIETITFTERLNTGNYNHLELTATAKVEENETPMTAMLALKTLVHTALVTKSEEASDLKDEVEKLHKINETLRTQLGEATIPDSVKPAEEVVEKKTRTRTKKTEVKEVAPEVEEETKVEEVKSDLPLPLTTYNREIEAHRQMLSSYLTTHFPSWKTKEGVKEFSASLVGKEFLDAHGIVVPSFEKLLNEFFA